MGNKLAIYLVSLPKDQERRNNLKITHNGKTINPDYTHAVNGAELESHNFLKKGEIGCYLSHVHMLEKALRSGYKYVLIIEDDVGKIELNQFYEYIQQAPPDFEILFLGYNYFENFTNEYEYEKIGLVHGTHCYIVNVNNLTQQKINNLFPIVKPIDLVLPTKFISYIIKPKVIELGEYAKYSNTQHIN